MRNYRFENLFAWQLGRSLRIHIYSVSKKFPLEEKYGLSNQIRRAVGSITANLAESSGRFTFQDKMRYVSYAYSSGLEVLDQIIAAKDLDYIDQQTYESCRRKIDETLICIEKYNAYLKNRAVFEK
jgi:four helix bundle protein